tara:strand:+ start:376884 stop:378086 length:1203 start_codon:yes stop_codon:yes gene_type:complete
MDRILLEQDVVATIVSKSSAESNQVHRIVNLVTEHHYTNNSNIPLEIEEENAALATIHKSLVEKAQEKKGRSASGDVISRIYFEQPYKLDTKVSFFIMKVEDYVDAIKAGEKADPDLYNYISRQSRGALTQALSSSLIIYENAFLTKVERLRMVQLAAILIIGVTLMLEAFAIFMPLVGRVSKYAERLHEISMTDMLTGIGNRRYFVRRARQEIKRAARLEKGLCICMVDIDFFKIVNDTHGHAAGDYVLREFVDIIKSAIRLEDDVARIGGEEFIILLPASDLESSLIVAERVRQRLEERPFVLPETGETLKVTASFGLTQVDTEQDEDIEIAMSRADEALYASKENGRNRVNYARFSDGEIVEAEITVQVTHKKPSDQTDEKAGRYYDNNKVTPIKPV